MRLLPKLADSRSGRAYATGQSSFSTESSGEAELGFSGDPEFVGESLVGRRDPLIEKTCQCFKRSSISGGAGVIFARSIDPLDW